MQNTINSIPHAHSARSSSLSSSSSLCASCERILAVKACDCMLLGTGCKSMVALVLCQGDAHLVSWMVQHKLCTHVCWLLWPLLYGPVLGASMNMNETGWSLACVCCVCVCLCSTCIAHASIINYTHHMHTHTHACPYEYPWLSSASAVRLKSAACESVPNSLRQLAASSLVMDKYYPTLLALSGVVAVLNKYIRFRTACWRTDYDAQRTVLRVVSVH